MAEALAGVTKRRISTSRNTPEFTQSWRKLPQRDPSGGVPVSSLPPPPDRHHSNKQEFGQRRCLKLRIQTYRLFLPKEENASVVRFLWKGTPCLHMFLHPLANFFGCLP